MPITIGDGAAIGSIVQQMWQGLANGCKVVVELRNRTDQTLILVRSSNGETSGFSGKFLNPPEREVPPNTITLMSAQKKDYVLAGNCHFVIYRIGSSNVIVVIGWNFPLVGGNSFYMDLSTHAQLNDDKALLTAIEDKGFVSQATALAGGYHLQGDMGENPLRFTLTKE